MGIQFHLDLGRLPACVQDEIERAVIDEDETVLFIRHKT